MPFQPFEKINLPLLLEYAASLPASPRIYARLAKLVANNDTSLDYISSLVKMDPGLAAQLLRVTNSAFYGASFKINDLETAISRIGFVEVQKVLNAIVENDAFYQALPAYGLTATEFADSCIDVAVAAEGLAKRVGLDPNAPYIAGLLLRIGKLAINVYLEKRNAMGDLAELARGRPIEHAELEALGVTHTRVSADLLSHWQFEPKIWQPIKAQANPQLAATHVKETAILHLAAWIAESIGGYDFEAALPPKTKWALGALGIDALDVALLIDEARFEINDRKNMLSMLL